MGTKLGRLSFAGLLYVQYTYVHAMLAQRPKATQGENPVAAESQRLPSLAQRRNSAQ